ncbi:MAG: dUTP diphosphatase [Acidobacteria bacterium]|nr:dUTP diphosphatase [Acidobacteriota bacterium]
MADGDLRIDIVQLDPDLPLPSYARAGDAGLDLRARTDALVPARGGRVLVPTGIAVAIPDGWVGLVVPRSGLALRHGVALANTPGVIDSGYRGELQAVVINLDPSDDYQVRRGDRIAQLLVQRVERVSWNPVAELRGEDRGGGFGHSGR